jgi:hypothetical protein
MLGALALVAVIGLGALGVAMLGAKIERDWTTVATVNGHGIDRESLRARVAVLDFLAKERAFFLQRSSSPVTPEQLPALLNQAAEPAADVVTSARESLIDDELARQLAAREGVATPAAPDPWSEARAYVAQDLAHKIRVVRFGLPASESSTSSPGSTSTPTPSPGPIASPTPSPTASPSAAPSNPWPSASGANLAAATERLQTELRAGTKVEIIVAGLHDAGWTVFGEDVSVSPDGVPADASLQLDPEIAAATLAGRTGGMLGPATDEYGRISMALLLAPADQTILANLLGPDADEAHLDSAALADWANAQSLRRALSDALLARWKTGGVTLAHFRALVIGNVPDSTGATGPWVELSGLSLDALASVNPASIAGAPPGLDLNGDKLAATLRSMPVADRTAFFARLVAAANAAAGGSGTSGEVGFATKDGLVPDVSKAAFDDKVKTGDILGPITTSGGPQLFLVEARYSGPLDDRAQAALQQVRADPAPDPAAYTTRFSPADLALASDAGWRADAEFGSKEDVRRALLDTPIGALSDPFALDGKLACAIVTERKSGIPDARTTARLTLDGCAAWFSSERAAAAITRSDHPLPELEPSASPSPSPTLSLPSGPVPETPALPTIPGVPAPTPSRRTSSGCRRCRSAIHCCRVSCGLVLSQSAVDLVADSPAQGSNGLPFGVVVELLAHLEVDAAGTVEADLADGDPVNSSVELAIAAPAEPMARSFAGPHGDRRAAVVAGVGRSIAEAGDPSGLCHDLGRGQRPTPGHGQKPGSKGGNKASNLGLQGIDSGAQGGQLADKFAGDPSHEPRPPVQALGQPGKNVLPAQPARWRFFDPELVEMPAQTALDLRSRIDQVLAMVDQQADLPLGSGQASHRQVRLAQGCAGDRESVYRIALAWLTPVAPRSGHQLRRHPHDGLARPQQVGFQATRQVSTILQGPAPVREAASPLEQPQVSGSGRLGCPGGKLATRLVGRHGGVAAFVQIDPDDDHLAPPGATKRTGRAADPGLATR